MIIYNGYIVKDTRSKVIAKFSFNKWLHILPVSLWCCIFFICLSSCKFGLREVFWRDEGVSSRSTSIQSIDPPSSLGDSSEYNCIVIADVHFGANGDNRVKSFLDWLDRLTDKPRFCLALGDFAEHGSESEYQDFSNLEEELKRRGIPTYGLVGNHDLYNSGYKFWRKYVEPKTPYYRFFTKSFDWYFLDTGNGTLGNPQLTDFLDKIDDDNRPKIILSHYPIYRNDVFYFTLSNTTERATLLTAFVENNVKAVLTGHYHPGGFFTFGEFTEFGTPGFHDYGMCGLLHVNEDNETVSFEVVSF